MTRGAQNIKNSGKKNELGNCKGGKTLGTVLQDGKREKVPRKIPSLLIGKRKEPVDKRPTHSPKPPQGGRETFPRRDPKNSSKNDSIERAKAAPIENGPTPRVGGEALTERTIGGEIKKTLEQAKPASST